MATTSPLTNHIGFINQARYGGGPTGWGRAGENLARGFKTSAEAMASLKASPTHNANLTNKEFQDTGVAIVKGTQDGQPSYYVVQFFGNQVPKNTVKTVVPKAPPKSIPPAKAKAIMKDTIKKSKAPVPAKRPISMEGLPKNTIPWNSLSTAMSTPATMKPLFTPQLPGNTA